MANNKTTVFSEFEAREMFFIFDSNDYYEVECIGKVEEESTTQIITKKCRGKVGVKVTHGAGEGTLKVTLHIPYELYIRLLDMEQGDLIEGVYAYGSANLHPEVCITALILDEHNLEKYVAWPRCTVSTGPNRSIENGADEVAEIEVEIGYMPDSTGKGSYEALAASLPEDIKGKWLTEFTPELVKAPAA